MRINKLLNRFWIDVQGFHYCPAIGVTAFSKDDAVNIINEKMPNTVSVVSIKVIHSLDDLEQDHVLPNMEEFVSRGVWYPKGFR